MSRRVLLGLSAASSAFVLVISGAIAGLALRRSPEPAHLAPAPSASVHAPSRSPHRSHSHHEDEDDDDVDELRPARVTTPVAITRSSR